MQTITDYEQLKALVSAEFKPGVLTNASVCERDYVPYIEAGTLEYEQGGFGLLLVRRKREHNYVSFWLNAGAAGEASPSQLAAFVASLPLPPRCLLEVAYRERDAKLKELAEALKNNGFEKQLGRIRYTRPADAGRPDIVPLDDGTTLRGLRGSNDPGRSEGLAEMTPSDAEEIRAFIAENFVERTGCWPSAAELAYDRVLEIRDGKGLCAIIHCQTDGPMPNIRHMAVRSDCRGQRLTAKLLSRFCGSFDGSRAMVWVKEHDEAAMHAYTRFGFAPDGRESVVLFKE